MPAGLHHPDEMTFHQFLLENTRLTMLSERLHDETGGNKAWKMQHILQPLKGGSYSSVVTIGGAYSNSILAVCAVAHRIGLNPIVYVRGEELATHPLNPLLHKAVNQYRATLYFISRDDYRNSAKRQRLLKETARETNGYIIQEGVSGYDGYLGVKTVFNQVDLSPFRLLCLPCATGTTLAGLLAATLKNKPSVWAFPVVNALPQISQTILTCLTQDGVENPHEVLNRVHFIGDYIFGGFAKKNATLTDFVRWFDRTYHIPLDFRYSGKMMCGLHQEILAGRLHGDGILCIHTGGLYQIPAVE